MGLLSKGSALKWEDAQEFIQYVKDHGVEQFINIYNQFKDKRNDDFYWGDELEYIIFKKSKNGEIRLNHEGYKYIEEINEMINLIISENTDLKAPIRLLPEYGSFMIESTPSKPYFGNTCDLISVETNMKFRRIIMQSFLKKNEIILTISNCPFLGTKNYFLPKSLSSGDIALSDCISDDSINPHPRFGYLTENIRKRRGSKVEIKVPIFKDKFTNEKQIEMDAMAFGMGCCCLQITLQAQNMHLSRFLYDQLVVLSPIFLALTASTPFHKGMISDWDVRWEIISQSVDCRTPEERNFKNNINNVKNNKNEENKENILKNGEKDDNLDKNILKSRFASVSSFLALKNLKEEKNLNDIDLKIVKKYYEKMIKHGVDHQMAKHIAHLFIRDPLVIFKEILDIDDTKNFNHFENIQSTNWQTCRLKPPLNNNSGWKVEFRSMEIQMTDFENAAFCVFVVLLSRAILFFNCKFYIPLSLVDKNMKNAYERDAVLGKKFFFAYNADPAADFKNCPKFDINSIVNGDKNFIGLMSIIREYLNQINCYPKRREIIENYLNFIQKRASGDLMTAAKWMRHFAINHPKYQQNSVLNNEICSDLIKSINDISNNNFNCEKLLGKFATNKNIELKNVKEDIEKSKDKNIDLKKRIRELLFSNTGMRVQPNDICIKL